MILFVIANDESNQRSLEHSVVLTPTAGVDPRDALATSMYAAPGVYALLVGSGMSTAGGILTGERIVDDLVRQIALQRGVPVGLYEENPRAWWESQTGHQPRYDALMAQLATTDGARQALLRRYFEVRADTGAPVAPTPAHRALSELAKHGYVRVVLTTNFDTLIEQALDAAGVAVQVLQGEESIRAKIPLVHSALTLIKLHGDYRNLGLRNSPLELSSYGDEQRSLLRQVFDEYGVIAVGWSAEWDQALVRELEGTMSRRYPLYWVSYRGALTDTAQRVIENRQASHVVSDGADDFLPDLMTRVQRLGERAHRRASPRVLRGYVNEPSDGLSNGWSAVPWLVLRAAASATGVQADEIGLLGPEVREQILKALQPTRFLGQLTAWNSHTVLDASPPRTREDGLIDQTYRTHPESPRLDSWAAVPGTQSVARAVYRIGGDGRAGVSAVAEVRLPSVGFGEPTFIFDVGVSIVDQLPLTEVAQVLRGGLLLVSSALPDAVSDILPPDTTVVRAEIHLLASRNDGQARTRDNTLDSRVGLDMFQSDPAHPRPPEQYSLGFGAEIPDWLTTLEAAEIIADGFGYLALAVGFLDPRPAIATIRSALGLR